MANTNSEIRFGFFQAFVPLSMQWEQIRNGWWGFYYCLTRSFCKNKYGATGQWKDPGKCKDAKNRLWAYHTGILLSFSSPVFLKGHLAFHSALLQDSCIIRALPLLFPILSSGLFLWSCSSDTFWRCLLHCLSKYFFVFLVVVVPLVSLGRL